MGLVYATIAIIELIGGSIIYTSIQQHHTIEGILIGATICILGIFPFFDT